MHSIGEIAAFALVMGLIGLAILIVLWPGEKQGRRVLARWGISDPDGDEVAAAVTYLRRGRFWLTLAITLAFQVPVDGWLTKLSAPIVLYRPAAISGARWPWDIPVEDFGFAFAMITLTLALWERARPASGASRASWGTLP